VVLALLLALPLIWFLIVVLVPTDWARQRVIGRVSALTGRPVQLAALRVGALGGITLRGLEIGAPGSAGDPWLKVNEARIDLSLLQLASGSMGPSRIQVDGVSLRVRRRADGTLELADLIPAPPGDGSSHSSGHDDTCVSVPEIQIRDAMIQVVDEPTRTSLEFVKVQGRGAKEERRVRIDELRGEFNGGPFELAAQLDGSTSSPSFEGHFRTRDVALERGMDILSYLVPLLAGTLDNVAGKMDLEFYVRGHGRSRDEIQQSLVGRGMLRLDPLQFEGSRLVAELAEIVDLPTKDRTGSIKGEFQVERSRVSTHNMILTVGRIPINFTGWTDFDGRLNYRVRTENLTDRLPGEARDLLSDLAIDLNKLTILDIRGTLDNLELTLDGAPLGDRRSDPGQRGDDRQRMLEFGRRLRDRILR
jgi:AsmA protein